MHVLPILRFMLMLCCFKNCNFCHLFQFFFWFHPLHFPIPSFVCSFSVFFLINSNLIFFFPSVIIDLLLLFSSLYLFSVCLIVYRLITAYLLLRGSCDKIMHARWNFDASSARTRRVSALDKHQNWSADALFCHNSRAYVVLNLIHTRRERTF